MVKKALVVVLGELARSPRMQYHCVSLANDNYKVTVIANGGGDKSCDELESNKNIQQSLMATVPDLTKYLPSILAYIIKPIWQSFILLYHLLLISTNHVIIVQNPPSIPTLPILCLYCKVTGTKLIIDWHNYGFSILSLNLKSEHPFVRASKAIEFYFGRMADAGFSVSETMKQDLVDNYHLKYPIKVVHDRPPKHFRPFTLREKHNFLFKMKKSIPEFRYMGESDPYSSVSDKTTAKGTRFTMTCVGSKDVITVRPKRPAIIMSSTSWTEDEDFGILLEALKRYDLARTNQLASEELSLEEMANCLPDLVCVITGKGPLKEYYKRKIQDCDFRHVEIVLPWLQATDYPKMVSSCDLGISLHTSSSGVDLPMKVVDMFGCGVPVLALNYKAIGELVMEDYYGLTFNDAEDLSKKLVLLLEDFYIKDNRSRDHVECTPMGRYKKNIRRHFLLSRWENNWNREAKPVFDKLYSLSSSK